MSPPVQLQVVKVERCPIAHFQEEFNADPLEFQEQFPGCFAHRHYDRPSDTFVDLGIPETKAVAEVEPLRVNT